LLCIALTRAALTAEGGERHDECGALRPKLDRRCVTCGMCGRIGHVRAFLWQEGQENLGGRIASAAVVLSGGSDLRGDCLLVSLAHVQCLTRERLADQSADGEISVGSSRPHEFMLGARYAEGDMCAARFGQRSRIGKCPHPPTVTQAWHAYARSATLVYVTQTQVEYRPQYRPRQHRSSPDEPQKSQVEFELDEPWTVTATFLNHGDELVLADIRIFPTRDTTGERGLPGDRRRQREWGDWSWDPDLVPAGGLTMRTVRKLSIGGAVREALANVPRLDGYLSGVGFVEASHSRVRQKSDDHVRRRRPELLARVALVYERAVVEGEPPNKTIHKELLNTPSQVAESSVPGLVRAARAAGYLTTAIKGRASGRATAAAHALVDKR